MGNIIGASPVELIAGILACPGCRHKLDIESTRIRCAGCGAEYQVREGVPLLARMGVPSGPEGQGASGERNTSEDYQKQYQDMREASQYNADYKERLFKRMSTRREFHLLRALLATQGHNSVILDMPCGGGRLSPQIGQFTDLLVEADIAEGQVLYGRKNCQLSIPQVWMTASAFCLPFLDNSVDGVVCCRLCHHMPTPQERERLITEILRVSRKFVLMTFFDYNSVKNLLRRARRVFDGQPPKNTMKVREVADLARQNGARLVEYPSLAFFSSGHRYALMVKEETKS
jgi:ubiquinone/menaquinone biosynthesis C-methylase UbiE